VPVCLLMVTIAALDQSTASAGSTRSAAALPWHDPSDTTHGLYLYCSGMLTKSQTTDSSNF
jgi:hypothetical protein